MIEGDDRLEPEAEQPGPEEETPQVFAVKKEPDGEAKFTRRTFIEIAAASAAGIALVSSLRTGKAGAASPPGQYLSPQEANLYGQPSAGGAVIERLNEGDMVRLIGRNSDGSWAQVETASGNTGWVGSQFLDFSRAVERKAPAPVQPSAAEPEADTMYGLAVLDANHAWAVGLSGQILFASNQGKSLVSQVSGTTYSLYAVCFTDVQNGWAVGDAGTILHTSNGGQTWLPQTSPTDDDIHSVFFLDAQTG